MAVYDFFLSRNSSAVTVNDYVGHAGRLFYDDTGVTGLRISDGITPGGSAFTAAAVATASSPGIVQPGAGLQVDELGILTVKAGDGVTFDGSNIVTLAPATADSLGGIKLGPGVTLNAEDQLVIDSEGLDFTFGDLSSVVGSYADTTNFAQLSSNNTDEDIVVASNGDGAIRLVGPLYVYATNSNVADAVDNFDPLFQVNELGEVSAKTLDIRPGEGLDTFAPFNVSTHNGGITTPPDDVAGTIAQFTGRDDYRNSIIQDNYGSEPGRGTGGVYVFRTANGTAETPTSTLENDQLGAIGATGYTSDDAFSAPSSRIAFVASEDFNSTSRGGKTEFWNMPVGSTVQTLSATINTTGITLEQPDANINNVSGITFNTSHVDDHTEEGTLCWSSEDSTLNLHHESGVVQQIGQESFVYVHNNSGSPIANGAVVRFDGADDTNGYRIEVASYLADGTHPNIYLLGVATQSIADGASGMITVFGKVREVNTSAFNVGDILYADPSVAGGLVNMKPTSPDNVVPVAAVLRVDDELGEIFVRPTLDQRQDYARFSRNTDVTAANTNTAYTVNMDTVEQSSGVTISTPASRMIVRQSGLYNVSVQGQSYSGGENGNETWYMWLRKNGTDVPRSMKRTSTTDDLLYNTLSFSFTLSLDANDYVEVAYAFSDTGLRFEAVDATGFGPSTSAVVVDITQIQN